MYIWALQSANSYVSYHGRDNRGHQMIDWSRGRVPNSPPPSPPPPPPAKLTRGTSSEVSVQLA